MIDLGTIGALKVLIGGDTSQLAKALANAEKDLSKTELSMEGVAKGAKVLAGVLAATAGTIAFITKKAIDHADATYKMSQASGVAMKTLSELNYVAGLSGVSTEMLSTSMSRLNRNASDAARGTGEAKDAFDALGIKVTHANGAIKSADQLMAEVADRFADFPDGPEKSALAIAIFGRAGAAMIPMLNQGAAKMKELRQEAIDLGLSLETDAGKAAEEFNDNIEKLGKVVHGAANQLMVELLPALVDITAQVFEAAKESKGFQDEMRALADFIKTGTLVLFQTIAVTGANVAFVFKTIGLAAGATAARLEALKNFDFKGFKLIGEEWEKDVATARKDLDDFEKRIMGIKVATSTQDGGAMDMGGSGGVMPSGKQKAKGPRMRSKEDEEAQKKAVERTKQLLEEDTRNWVKHAEEVLAAEEKRLLDLAAKRVELEEQIKSQIEDEFVSELDREQAKFDEKMKLLDAALNAEVITKEKYRELEESLLNAHQIRISEIEKKGWTERQKFAAKTLQNQATQIFGELASITAGVAQHNKTMFQINKVAGIASAILNAYEGISKTLKAYPYPLNIGMAAAHAAAAFAQVNAIRSTQFGGGGGAAPSLAGGTPATPVTPVDSGVPGGSRERQSVIVNLPGEDFVSKKNVRALLTRINEEIADGARLQLNG